jgi:hypothetical protein
MARRDSFPRPGKKEGLIPPRLWGDATATSRSKRSKGYNSLKNAGVFLNIVGVAAVAAVAAHTDIS